MPTRHHNPGRRRQRRSVTGPDTSLLTDAVAMKTLDAMYAASAQLTKVGVRHALAGGLAVGAYGYPRATKDVDFLVDDDAFEVHGGGIVTIRPGVPVAVGDVSVDEISIGDEDDFLHDALAAAISSHGIPVLPIEALVYMKLRSPRRRDRVDIEELVKAGADVDAIIGYLQTHAADLVGLFVQIVGHADEET